jgi:enoyl-CoA hydratase
MALSLLSVEVADGVARVTIDNPPANALTDELYAQLDTTVTQLELDDAARAVVFASAHPEIFVAGADVKRMADYDFRRGAVTRKIDLVHACFLRVQRLSKPTVAAIAGHALGGGCELALAMDFRFMGRGHPRIGLPEASLGIIPGGGGTQRLPRLVGRARAAELVMLAQRIDAGEAERIGLVNRALAREEVVPAALALAREIAEGAPMPVRGAKQALAGALDRSLEEQLRFEAEQQARNYETRDLLEGVAAVREKRAARFEGR